ncbi:MAG: type VI secretion system accessory protein TagJ [Opitutaceae bacterium]
MIVEDHIKSGNLTAALEALQNKIRANGADAQLRLSLVQVLCVIGNWDRAKIQLQTLDSMGDEYKGWTGMVGQALMAEALRREVFAGRTTPLVLGEPSPWMAQLIQALNPADPALQASLRSHAFEAAPAVPASVNGVEVEWVADADSRLGPVLEAMMEGKYYWIPFERIRRLSIAPATDLRHLVWLPAQATWITGGESSLLIPCRYVGSESAKDDRLRLSRRTEWEEIAEGQYRGLGQRMFTAGESDYPLLDVRTIEFKSA